MKQTVRAMSDNAARLGTTDGDDLWKHARRSEGRARIEAAIALAQSELRVIARANELDAEPYLLTVENGTLDLRNGELDVHDRAHLITKLAPVVYETGAHDPRWERFLAETTQGDVELLDFLQRFAGYCLTGDTSEEVLLFAHGPTATGKSTLLDALKGTLGEYAVTADFETFVRRRDGGGPRSGLAQLAGARLVTSLEVDKGKELAEALVKALTGGDPVRASFLYSDSFEYVPAFKLCLAANHAPTVSDDDDAIWRRILRVPFEHQVPPERRDRGLKAYLRRPNAAILAWALEGSLAWQAHGLGVPRAVNDATAAYRADMDPLSDFVAERCVLAPGARVSTAALWGAYLDWARDGLEREMLSRQGLAERLQTRHVRAQRARLDGRVTRFWSGIGLRDVTP